MIELNKFERDSERQSIESVVKKKQQKELKLENSIKPYKGHKVFEINVKTLAIKEASFIEHKLLDITKYIHGAIPEKTSKDIAKKPNCVYVSALNSKSALKRYKKDKGSAVIEMSNESINPF